MKYDYLKRRTLTTSALGSPSSKEQFPVQYMASGEPQRLMGDIVLPYHASPSKFSVVMERDFFDLVRIGCIWARSLAKVPGCDETGDERT